MRLRHLRVKNIRSYVSGSIDFADGTTLISGDVGAGKTSLLYAIEMALFGTSEVDAAYLVRHRAPHAEAAVAFEDAEHRYEISRRFRRVRRKGKETFEPEAIAFSIDGAKTEYSATELRQRVIELLGFPDNPNPQAHSDLWRWAVYVPQERMRDILGAKPQDRLETVRKALGVEKYRTAAENSQEVAAELRRTAVARKGEADRLRHHDEEFASWSQEADRLRLERVTLVGQIERRRAEVLGARGAVAEADTEVRKIEADRRELASLDREDEADRDAQTERAQARDERADALARRRAEAEGARDEAGGLESRRRALAETDTELARCRNEIDRHAADLRQLIQARADLTAARRRVESGRATLERALREQEAARLVLDRRTREGPAREPPAPTPDSLEEIDRRLEAARQRERERLTEETRAESALHEFEELLAAGVCPRCGQTVRTHEFEDHRSEAAALAAEAAEAHGRATSERAEVERERRSRERYERARDHWLEVERERESARGSLRTAEENARAAIAGDAEARAAVEDARSRVERWAPLDAREAELRGQYEAQSSEQARRAELVARAAAAAEKLRAAGAAIEILEAELVRLDREASVLRDRSEERADRIRALRKLLEGAEEKARRLTEAQAALAAAEGAAEIDHRTLVRVDTRLDEAVRRVAEAEEGRAERAARIAEAADLEAKAAWVSGAFRRMVLTMEQRLLAHAQAAFERSLTRYFAALIDDPSLVARTDVAFTPAVSIEGEWTPAEALSGGERTSLALAFRLALAEVVRTLGHLRLDTILLDEPTDGFSPEQVVRMGELLETLALPQVIVVSHEDELAGIADRVVRLQKIGGKSILRSEDASTTERESLPAAPEDESKVVEARPGPRARATLLRGNV